MTPQFEVQIGPAPPALTAHNLVRWLCTKNPFYVI